MLKVTVVILLPEEGHSRRAQRLSAPGRPRRGRISRRPNGAGRTIERQGAAADTLPGAKRLFLPIRTGRGPVGVVGLGSEREGSLLSPDQRRLLDALCDQAALAIERTTLAHDLDNARLLAETDRLRSALLTSISHDLQDAAGLDPRAPSPASGPIPRPMTRRRRRTSWPTVQEEAERLNRFIANLLDMTRLEFGVCCPGPCLGRSLGGPGQRLEASSADPGRAQDRPASSRPGPAHAAPRLRALRASALQFAGQCGQICARRLDRGTPRASAWPIG